MNKRFLIASATGGFAMLAATAALASSGTAYVCRTWNPSKIGPAVTDCLTWAREAAVRLHAAPCDPRTMTAAEMRARCAALMAQVRMSAPPGAPR